MMPIAVLDHVSLRYAGLTDISFNLGTGEVTALLGPSGAGKSSLLRLLMGLVAPDGGRVLLGQRVASLPGRVVVPPEQRRLGVVFQDLALWPHFTVAENLAFALGERPAPQARERITSLLAQLGLTAKASVHPGELSGGERQRVAIARALVVEPELVLLDEPLSNLDVALKDDLLALFAELLRARHSTALYVTHDPREAEALADRVVIVESGSIAQAGPLAEVCALPATEFVRHVARTLRR